MLIDTHAHPNFAAYKNDLEDVVGRIQQEDMKVINVGSQMSTSKRAIELAEKYKCSRHYTNYEIAGKCRARIRNHLIMTLFFPEENSGIISFLIHIKTMSMVHLESVSYDNCIFILLYVLLPPLGDV